jgi:hypothetical protein
MFGTFLLVLLFCKRVLLIVVNIHQTNDKPWSARTKTRCVSAIQMNLCACPPDEKNCFA